MVTETADSFRDLVLPGNERKFIETLMVVESKDRVVRPFRYNNIQALADSQETGMDIWVKPGQVGFSTERIAKRLANALCVPGTNIVLIAYEETITGKLLSKVNFFYNYLNQLRIPGFPEIHHDSTYEKSFRFYEDGAVVGTSTMYIASARSYVAGRSQTIHHLLCDEFAFYPEGSLERVVLPALARIPTGGTADIFSTPNGEDNDFHEVYSKAKLGDSLFTPHFYPWWFHDEYQIKINDERLRTIPETNYEEFQLSTDEQYLMNIHDLTFDQIRWRRFMVKLMESMKREGQTRTLFAQEFPEDDVSCFLTTGDMYYEEDDIERIAKTCYDAPIKHKGLNIWYPPEEGQRYIICIDPGQSKITQTSIGVLTFKKDEDGFSYPIWCARDVGWYAPDEDTTERAIETSNYYNRGEITWEANGHGLAITALLKNRRPIYMRKDIAKGIVTMVPGWYTSGGKTGTKEYMLTTIHRHLPNLVCHDIELVRQLRNFRKVQGKVEILGPDDIHDSLGLGLVCYNPTPLKRGIQGTSGFKW